MTQQIVVLLRRRDRSEEILPYLEEVTRPGMKVVFLMPFPVDPETYWHDHWITTESSRVALSEGKQLLDRTSWHVQKDVAERGIAVAREALRKRGIDVGVDLYTGSLTRVVSDYTANREVHLIMVWAGIRSPMARLLGRAVRLLGFFRRPVPSPVLLLHTNNR